MFPCAESYNDVIDLTGESTTDQSNAIDPDVVKEQEQRFRELEKLKEDELLAKSLGVEEARKQSAYQDGYRAASPPVATFASSLGGARSMQEQQSSAAGGPRSNPSSASAGSEISEGLLLGVPSALPQPFTKQNQPSGSADFDDEIPELADGDEDEEDEEHEPSAVPGQLNLSDQDQFVPRPIPREKAWKEGDIPLSEWENQDWDPEEDFPIDDIIDAWEGHDGLWVYRIKYRVRPIS